MGLIPIFPAGSNVTGNITITMVLALSSFIAINAFGSKHYWKDIFWPEVPTWLKVPVPLMPVIEFVGIFTKPFSLMIRLFANIMAGHAVILILTCIVFATAEMGAAINASMSVVAVFLAIFMNCLELMVAFLQAFVFTMLTSVFIGFAQMEGEHAEHTEHTEK
jgi:F-type H+-transporting ATPase subunit a